MTREQKIETAFWVSIVVIVLIALFAPGDPGPPIQLP